MALNLGSLFGAQSNSIQNSGTMQTVGAAGSTASVQTQEQQRSLPVGSVVSGQVVETRGDTVTLRMDDGSGMQARMEDGVALSKGSYVSFEVSGVSDTQVCLKALFTNTAAGFSTMSAALSQAGIPETAESFSMVRSMMENGMPIDKNSLLSMYRQVTSRPQAASETIVDMTKLGLPLTEENVNQFEAYRNLEHQITRTVDTVTESMQKALDELAGSGDTEKALTFIKDVALLLSEDETVESGLSSERGLNGEGGSTGEGVERGSADHNAFLRLVDTAIEEEKDAAQEQSKAPATGETAQESAHGIKPQADDPMAALMKALTDAGSRIEEKQEDQESRMGQKIVIAEKDGAALQAGAGKVSLSDMSKEMPAGEALKEVAKGLSELLAGEKTPQNAEKLEKALAILQGKDLKEMLSDAVGRQWRMEPGTVFQKEDVQEFYEKLRNQTGRFAQTIENTLGKENQLFEQVTNIRQNVDFMNALNQSASYVQLPLKLGGEDAHGDLYVYTNKKNLASADGRVSAFLHLDMDHLGPVDVYVAMENASVSTNFYLKDDAMIDFIGENIHILNERLQDRGYNMSCKMTLKEDPAPVNVIDEIMEDHAGGFLIGSKSFDVRA